MTSRRSTSKIRLILVTAWLALNLSLTSWWLVFGLQQTQRLRDLEPQFAPKLFHHQRMLMWEGGILLFSLLMGGFSLLYLVGEERKRNAKIRQFFAAFSHDLKTSLASLRLQGEALEEDLGNSTNPLMRRLFKDIVRLELQLENSLLLSNLDSAQLLNEDISVSKLLNSLEQNWPDLHINVKGDALVHGDRRALESVMKNLIQNSIIHGRASQITANIEVPVPGRVLIDLEDNGSGFEGNPTKLGTAYYRHKPSSGSGIGLHLSKSMAKKMNGSLEFLQNPKGFRVRLCLPEGVTS